MQYRHHQHCEEYHRPLQDHKGHLVIGDGTVETLLQLRNTIDRTDEDEHHGRTERVLKQCELLCVPQLDEVHSLGALARLAEVEQEFQPQAHEDEKRDDLKHNTGHHDGSACVACGVIVSRGREPAAGPLEDERYEVARHERDCVCAWAETGDVLAVDDDYAREAEV